MLDWLRDTSLAQYVFNHASAQQTLETIHMAAFALVIGAIMVLSFRLVGVTPRLPVTALARPVKWIAIGGFAVLIITGFISFMPRGEVILGRWHFQLKIALILVALLNLWYLLSRVRRAAGGWDDGGPIPAEVKWMAAASLILWPTIVIIARLMYFIAQIEGESR